MNLAPADIRKDGSSYDLPVAVGILVTSGLVAGRQLAELALGARKKGLRGTIVPRENGREAALVRRSYVYPFGTLRDVAGFVESGASRRLQVDPGDLLAPGEGGDFADVKGQESVKRALEVAAAGAHTIILIGPPGSGRTMLAKRLPGILPTMKFEEPLGRRRSTRWRGSFRRGRGTSVIAPSAHPTTRSQTSP